MLFRAIIQGDPGSGKNGLLASASRLGYRIIIASFEPETSEVTRLYAAHPENVHVVPFADDVEWEDPDPQTNVAGGLKRRAKGLIAFERFLYSGRVPGQPKGEPPPFGKPSEWGDRTICVLDTLTTLGDAAETRQLELNPLTREGRHLWQAAEDQEAACSLMVSSRVGCHSIVLSHLRLITPKAESGYKDETELQKQVKRERAQLEESGYFPTAKTPGIARNFVQHFPFALLCELDHKAKNASQRVLRTRPVFGYQIKCPLDIPDKLPIETALATILEKLGAA